MAKEHIINDSGQETVRAVNDVQSDGIDSESAFRTAVQGMLTDVAAATGYATFKAAIQNRFGTVPDLSSVAGVVPDKVVFEPEGVPRRPDLGQDVAKALRRQSEP